MHEEAVVAADLVAHLAGGLEERQPLDVADGAADLGDDDIRQRLAGADRLGRLQAHPSLDLVGDVRDDLHGVAEVLAAALLGDDGGVDLAGGDVGGLAQVDVQEALVVADVQVGLGAVVGDEHLAVLERVHRARVDVEIGVEFLHDDAEAACRQKISEAGSCEPFSKARNDSPSDENVLGRFRNMFDHHGVLAYHRRAATPRERIARVATRAGSPVSNEIRLGCDADSGPSERLALFGRAASSGRAGSGGQGAGGVQEFAGVRQAAGRVRQPGEQPGHLGDALVAARAAARCWR